MISCKLFYYKSFIWEGETIFNDDTRRIVQLNRKVFALIPIAALMAVLFFVGGPDYYSSRSYKHFWDLGHILFFAIIAYIILALCQRLSNQSLWRQCAWIYGMTLCLGLIVEFGQSGLGRSTSFGDLIRNFVGASLVLYFRNPSRKSIPKPMPRILKIITIAATVICALPLAVSLTDEWIAESQFPVLADFDTPFEIYRWSGNTEFDINNNISFHGKSSLKVHLNTSKYSGVALKYFPPDWRGYNAIKFCIYNPSSAPLKITCRIHDSLHIRGQELYEDRFNHSYVITAGWNQITIDLGKVFQAPKNRRMITSKIQGFEIFAMQLLKPRVIYMDYIRLSK